MVAARDLKYPARVGENALFDVLDPSSVHAHWHLVLGLARYRTGVTTDALAVIDYETVFHPWKISTRKSQSYLGQVERGVTFVTLAVLKKKTRWRAGRHRPAETSTVERLVVRSLLDQVFDDAVRFVDVLQRAMPQSMGKAVIFFFRDVVTRPV